jgi:hypothetical protein
VQSVNVFKDDHMSDETESRSQSRFATAAAIALSLTIFYVLSIGPVVGLCYSQYFNNRFNKSESRDQTLMRIYFPLIRTAEAIGANSVVSWYSGVFGRTNRPRFEKLRALSLLAAAQDALAAGDIERARSLTLRARSLRDVRYRMFGVSPELVLERIKEMERSRGIGPTSSS